jgi:CRISPR-associated protein Csx10
MADALYTLTLQLKLESEAIFTKDSASIGVPETLDAPPGATLLGAAAGRLYAQLGERAFEAFQLGGLRFADALPVVDGACALPTPLSWHKAKTVGASAPVVDLAVAKRQAKVQYVQERGGRVWVDSQAVRRSSALLTRSSMRTAIDEGGRAREGLLYGFEAVPAGQTYLTQISGAEPSLVEAVVDALLTRPLRLGRSRNAEFGVATVSRAASGAWPSPGAHVRGQPLRLLCLSELALRDPTSGAPSLHPDATALGLPSGFKLDLRRSFLRTRSYTPWNGHRRRPDLTRDVIVAGSVLVFEADGALSAVDAERLAAGVGEYTGAGLGRLLCQPELLSAASFALEKPAPAGSPDRSATPAGPGALHALAAGGELGELGHWLAEAHSDDVKHEQTWAAARSLAASRSWRVSRSQWGRVRAVAAAATLRPDDAPQRAALLNELRALVDGVSVKTWGSDADVLFGEASGGANSPRVGGALEGWSKLKAGKRELDKGEDKGEGFQLHFARAVQLLARLAARRTAQEEQTRGEQ